MFWSGEVHTSRLNHLRYDNSTWLNFKKQLQDGTLVEQVWHRHHNHPRAPPLSLLIKNQSLSMKMQVVWNTLNPFKNDTSAPLLFTPNFPEIHRDEISSTRISSWVSWWTMFDSPHLCVYLLCSSALCVCLCAQMCVCVYLLCPCLHQLSHLTTLKALAFLVARWNSYMMDIMKWKGGGTHESSKAVWMKICNATELMDGNVPSHVAHRTLKIFQK